MTPLLFLLSLTAPIAPRHPHTVEVHGDVRTDDYAWLKERENPETLEYLCAENAYAEKVMEPCKELQEALYCEMRGSLDECEMTVPAQKGEYFYYTRYEKGKSYPLHCRKKGSLEAPEEVYFDENSYAGQGYFALEFFDFNRDQTLLLFGYDCQGDERNTLKIKNLTTGALLEEALYPTVGNGVLSAEGTVLFYLVADAALRPYRLYRHRVGEEPQKDELLYEEKNPCHILSLNKSKDGRVAFVRSKTKTSSSAYTLDLNHPEEPLKEILPFEEGVKYYVVHHYDEMFLLTNKEAPDFKVLRWKGGELSTFVPHRPGVLIEKMEIFDAHMALFIRKEFKQQIEVIDLKTCASTLLSFAEPTYSLSRGANLSMESPVLRFVYTSLVTPESIYDYNLCTSQVTLRQQKKVPCYDSEAYAEELFFASAPDGTSIPLSFVYKKGCPLKGVLLTGYGAYAIAYPPAFSSNRLSLLNRGIGYAVAHIRGGNEGGSRWYAEGKMLHKKNTFTDFIACAEYLIARGIVTPACLAIEGKSAGGLLIGAVLNARPDLFGVAIAGVPFVDALNTMLDPSIPLTLNEYDEWGNPQERESYFYIKSYSPYENVSARFYPALLITGGLNDPRVGYWEPAKWAAALRAKKSDVRPLLLKTESGAGHFGASDRYDFLREEAFKYAFILKNICN